MTISSIDELIALFNSFVVVHLHIKLAYLSMFHDVTVNDQSDLLQINCGLHDHFMDSSHQSN